MTSYTTDAEVRREAGFQNNANVIDENDITPQTNAANAEVQSAVSAQYSVPLTDNSTYI